MAVETRCLGDVDAMVIASPNATVNRFSSFAKTPRTVGFSNRVQRMPFARSDSIHRDI
jgi:hypothetical protein